MKLKRFLSVLLFAVILTLSVFSVGATTSTTIPDKFEDKQNELESQANELENDLDEKGQAIDEKQKQIDELNAKIDELEIEMDALTLEIDGYTKEIEGMEETILDLEDQIEEDYVVLGNRLKEIYMAGEASNLEILFGAKDFEDLVDKINLVGFISDHDQKLIDDMKGKINEISSQKEQVAGKKELVEENKKELEISALEYEGYVTEANAVLDSLKKESDSIAKQLEDNEKEQDALSDEISEWHKEYVRQQKEAEEKRKAEEAARIKRQQSSSSNSGSSSTANTSNSGSGGSSSGSGSSSNSSGNSSGGSWYRGSGNYTWPAPECTYVTAYWGDSRNHKGMDLACAGSAYGKPIVAAESGTVIKANSTDSWGSGWGYYIMINHGSGYATQYAHCSVVSVSVGQYVERGQVIGYIGNTGNSFGAHLHFECWYNGSRYDPWTELS